MVASMDLMQGESDPTRLVFPGAVPVRELTGFGGVSRRGRRRRRRNEERPPADWDDVFQSQEPVVIRREHALARWPALTPEALAESMREVRVHVSAARTVQMMSRVQPWGSLPELTWRRPWAEQNVSAAQLFVDGVNASDEHLYFFSPVSELPAAVRAVLGELSVLTTLFQPMVEANAWAGVPGVSSPLHYDAAHNVYLQLTGHKRFVLLPAEHAPNLYPFPRLHPSTRQSQIDLRALPPDRFGRFHAALHGAGGTARLRPREVVLGPADTLYIPPYVWHRASVAGDRSAFSVAVYSQSTPMDAYPVLKAHPLPLQRTPSATAAEVPLRDAPPSRTTVAQLHAYCMGLASLRPPNADMSVVDDGSFDCLVQGRCECLRPGVRDAHEGRDALRELHATRFAPLLDGDDGDGDRGDGGDGGGGGGDDNRSGGHGDGLSSGLSLMLRRAREEW
eukprot:CAMPEP_0119100190 /NCGR_PEP_ID=MMETSP1178-20130426/185463_1 /TAXON_ID=33656 /ORGANISM="unid sp, Strain CCMP2000" /LENGTH=449 /DNA_ID=CAMNT_0007084171 /DNA_START=165 /DNA_END=1511 /DNA_ORIENTATION=-